MRRQFACLVTVSILMTVIPSCHRGPLKPDGLPATCPCVITITQAGVPLEDAMVQMYPKKDGERSWATAGITQKDGNAKMWTYAQWEGAPPGAYKITVTKCVTEGAAGKEIVYSLVDQKYSDRKTSGLEIEVVNGRNTKSFDVGASVKSKVSSGM